MVKETIRQETRKRMIFSFFLTFVSLCIVFSMLSYSETPGKTGKNELMILGLQKQFEDFSHKRLGLSGWAQYEDTVIVSGNEFTVAENGSVTLPNGAHNIIDHQLPLGVDSFYSRTDTTIIGRNGDGLNFTIDFLAKPTSPADTRLTISIDVGGAIGEIFGRDFVLSKGSGVTHNYVSSITGYTLNTWEANGGKVKVKATGGDVEIWNIRYVITRTHKAR